MYHNTCDVHQPKSCALAKVTTFNTSSKIHHGSASTSRVSYSMSALNTCQRKALLSSNCFFNSSVSCCCFSLGSSRASIFYLRTIRSSFSSTSLAPRYSTCVTMTIVFALFVLGGSWPAL